MLEQQIQDIRSVVASSFDVVYRQIEIRKQHVCLIFLSSLSDNAMISDLVESIVITANHDLHLTFYPGAVDKQKNRDKAITNLLSGQCLVLLEGSDTYYCIETRQYPSRTTAEPSVEKSVRGSHDGFVEYIILNVGLIRRRIRDPKLRIVINK